MTYRHIVLIAVLSLVGAYVGHKYGYFLGTKYAVMQSYELGFNNGYTSGVSDVKAQRAWEKADRDETERLHKMQRDAIEQDKKDHPERY